MDLKPLDIEQLNNYGTDTELPKAQEAPNDSESLALLSRNRWKKLSASVHQSSTATKVSRNLTRKLHLGSKLLDGEEAENDGSYFDGFVEQIIPVVFATFLNLLEVVAYGAIFLPNLYGNVNVAGICTQLLIITTVVTQITYALMSKFKSVIATEMCDNIPFLHTLATGISSSLSALPNSSAMVLPTTLVAIALSTILNGVIYIALGYFKVGSTLSAFPRYVILGMVFGFGVFISSTVIQLSTGNPLSSDTFSTLDSDDWIQLVVVVLAEIGLRGVIYFGFSEIFVSIILLVITPFFYLCLYSSGGTISDAQQHMWLFAPQNAVQWNETWDYFQFANVSWIALFQNIPTIICLGMYSALVIPMRIPSLALTTGEDYIDFDEELIVMGTGNVVAGLLGSPHNLLAYGNSVMYLDLKGKGKSSQLSVAVLTFGLFFVGPNLIAFLPRLIASLIMLHLGVDLITNSLVKSSKSLTTNEYTAMLILGVIVSVFGFVVGMAAGVFLACITVVVESARISVIREIFSKRGDTRSNTRWSAIYADLLDQGTELGHLNIKVVQLQGHLFFTNSNKLVQDLEHIVFPVGVFSFMDDNPISEKENNSLRYLVLDCSFITGADVNAVGALAKLKRQMKSVNILFAGVSPALMPVFHLEITEKVSKPSQIDPIPLATFFYNDVMAALHAVEENAIKKLHSLNPFTTAPLNSPVGRVVESFFEDSVKGVSSELSSRDKELALKKIFEALLNQGNASQREQRKKSFFSHDEVFKRLGMLFLKNVVVHTKGEKLWEEGQPAISMGLLLSGSLESVHGSGGHAHIMPGAMVGIMGLLCLQNHQHTVTALEESQVAYLSVHDWDEIQLNDTEVQCELQQILILYLSSRKSELLLFEAGTHK